MVKVVQKLFTPAVTNEQEEPETVLDSSFVSSASFVDTDVDADGIDTTHQHR